MVSRQARILILCKTYPSPSGKHIETSCVAGMREDGSLIRLYPVPFRLIDGDKQFKKWQWINVRTERSPNDNRPESNKIFIDTISCDGEPITSAHDWRNRRPLLERISSFSDFDSLEAARISSGTTLGLLHPTKVLGLEINEAKIANWTAEERNKLVQHEAQFGLFGENARRQISTLRKLPYDFYYNYECNVDGASKRYRHKIIDWEVGALYWNCRRKHGSEWEEPFRDKIERSLSTKDLMFLMGTIHRFPDQWLIISLFYPPKQQAGQQNQLSLFGP